MATVSVTRSERSMTLYQTTERLVRMILVRDYGMTKNEAKKAIAEYRLEEFFIADPDMAAHDSNEEWAKRIYEYYKL